jgi:hypothetical protein
LQNAKYLSGNDSNFGFDGCFGSRGKLAFDTKDSFRPDNKRKMSKMWGDGDVSEPNKSFLKEKRGLNINGLYIDGYMTMYYM